MGPLASNIELRKKLIVSRNGALRDSFPTLMALHPPVNEAVEPSVDPAVDLASKPSAGSVFDSSSTVAHSSGQNTPALAPTTPVVVQNAGWPLA